MAPTRPTAVDAAWYAFAPADGAKQLATLRDAAAVEVLAADAERVWLRGAMLDDRTARLLRSVLGCQVFLPLDDQQLVPQGAGVPRGFVPQGAWTRIEDWLELTLPTSRFTARAVLKAPLRLERWSHAVEPRLVRLPRGEWIAYASTAPRVRLNRLMYAASDEHVVVTGGPLPPVAGQFFCIDHGVAAPIGYRWRPHIDAVVLKEAWGVGHGDMVLLHSGGCERIRGDQFVGASHSSVRQLAEGSGVK